MDSNLGAQLICFARISTEFQAHWLGWGFLPCLHRHCSRNFLYLHCIWKSIKNVHTAGGHIIPEKKSNITNRTTMHEQLSAHESISNSVIPIYDAIIQYHNIFHIQVLRFSFTLSISKRKILCSKMMTLTPANNNLIRN